jgi:uncharacterized membrane protein HdeD (DUF308 family)
MSISTTPDRPPGYSLTRGLAERLSRNWWVMLLDGLVLIVAGVLIFSIDWDRRSLATFIGALFIFEGLALAMTDGLDRTSRRTNVVFGILSIAAGVAIIVWPSPGLVAVAVFLGAWLIVTGTVTIVGAFSARKLLPYWGLWLIMGVCEVALGVLALADPGATLAAIITVAGIWAVAIGVMRVALAFEIKRLPHEIDKTYDSGDRNGRVAARDATTSAADSTTTAGDTTTTASATS